MESKIKEMNEAILSYTVSATTQVVELNQRLWNDYVTLSHNLANMIPGMDKFISNFKK